MANEESPTLSQPTIRKTDWEGLFEDPQTGFISLIVQARTPAALRKSTALVIKSIYTHGDTPPEIKGFADELEHMLPDNLPASALPKIITAITTVLREIKEDRIHQEEEYAAIDGFDDLDDDDDSKPKKKRWWNRGKKKKNKKPKKNKKTANKRVGKSNKKKGRKPIIFFIFMGIILLLGLSGGGVYYYFFTDREPDLNEDTLTLIDQMTEAAKGTGPDHHIFGWALTVVNRAGLTGVTADGIPAEACASAAWYFVNRGNILINDKMPGKVSPTLLRRFCEEMGDRAKLTWLSKQAPASD